MKIRIEVMISTSLRRDNKRTECYGTDRSFWHLAANLFENYPFLNPAYDEYLQSAFSLLRHKVTNHIVALISKLPMSDHVIREATFRFVLLKYTVRSAGILCG
jgi:hypothetical protein